MISSSRRGLKHFQDRDGTQRQTQYAVKVFGFLFAEMKRIVNHRPLLSKTAAQKMGARGALHLKLFEPFSQGL